jgi:hypothetical protein
MMETALLHSVCACIPGHSAIEPACKDAQIAAEIDQVGKVLECQVEIEWERCAQGSLGARFPGCLEEIMLGRVRDNADQQKRDAAVIRTILKKVLVALKRLHSLGELLCLNLSAAEIYSLIATFLMWNPGLHAIGSNILYL